MTILGTFAISTSVSIFLAILQTSMNIVNKHSCALNVI